MEDIDLITEALNKSHCNSKSDFGDNIVGAIEWLLELKKQHPQQETQFSNLPALSPVTNKQHPVNKLKVRLSSLIVRSKIISILSLVETSI